LIEGLLVKYTVILVIILAVFFMLYDYFLPEDFKKVLKKIFKRLWEGKKNE